MGNRELNQIKNALEKSRRRTSSISRTRDSGRALEDHLSVIYKNMEALTQEIIEIENRVSEIEAED